MKFYARFAYYLVGFIIGIFFVSMMWSQKGVSCNYFPNSRVLNDLRKKPFHYSPQADSAIAQGWIDRKDVKSILENGDVDFDRSNVAVKGGKLYVVEGRTQKQQSVVLEIVNGSDKATLLKIQKSAE